MIHQILGTLTDVVTESPVMKQTTILQKKNRRMDLAGLGMMDTALSPTANSSMLKFVPSRVDVDMGLHIVDFSTLKVSSRKILF